MSFIPPASSKFTSKPKNVCEIYIVIPPDGGWGWVVLVSCFFLNFFIDGITYCFGIFLEDIGHSFQVHPTTVGYTSSVLNGFYYFAGPLSCGLSNRFGFRAVGVIGTLISAVAFLISSFLPSLMPFMMVFGIVGGIGFNMIYSPCLLVIGFYFERWRALCTAISVTGTSVGIAVFPILMNNLMSDFDWRVKFRILGGVCVGLSLLVMTFRPIKPTKIYEAQPEMISIGGSAITSAMPTSDGLTVWEYIRMMHDVDVRTSFDDTSAYFTYINLDKDENYADTPSQTSYQYQFRSQRTSVGSGLKYVGDVLYSTHKTCCACCYSCCKSQRRSVGENVRMPNRSSTPSDLEITPSEAFQKRSKLFKGCCYLYTQHDKHMNRPMYRDDIFFGGSVKTLPEYKATSHISRSTNLFYNMAVTRIQAEEHDNKRLKWMGAAVLKVISSMLDYKLLRSASFDLLLLSGFLTMLVSYTPFLYLMQRVEEAGIDHEWGSNLIFIAGISNMLGRICCGAICSIPRVNLLIVSYVTLFIAGAGTVMSFLFDELGVQIAFIALLGFNTASFTALRSVVLVNLMGLENLTNAFGIMIMFYGLANFLSTPIINFVQTTSNTYSYCYLFIGCTLLLSAFILVFIMPVKKREISNIE